MTQPDLQPLGDRAVLASFSSEDQAARWAQAVVNARLPGVIDVCLAYATAAVHADPDQVPDWDEWFRLLQSIPIDPASLASTGRTHRIPVCYNGPDLLDVARALDATTAEVVALHSGRDYRVFAVGFQPGFPYAGYLPDALSGVPRRASPRPRVAAGSVAIAGRQTGIYPVESPGGWHLLGRTPWRIVDLAAEFFPIEPGDWVRFEPIDSTEFDRLRNHGPLLPDS